MGFRVHTSNGQIFDIRTKAIWDDDKVMQEGLEKIYEVKKSGEFLKMDNRRLLINPDHIVYVEVV